MARRPRVHYEGAIYHVLARGNNREHVFESEEEKGKYLEILADYKKRYDFCKEWTIGGADICHVLEEHRD